jgi:Cys-tRNA(Pro) deacylase
MAAKTPVTAAVRFLRARNATFTDHLYAYEEKGGTAASARELGVGEHAVIKTLVLETDSQAPLIVLMHGDREISLQRLARQLGERAITVCRPEVATRHTGYLVGGTSPFGIRHPLPIYAEASIAGLPVAYINGGKRGYLVSMAGAELWRLLSPVAVEVAV